MSRPHTAFFYGTLMAPEVFFTVVQGSSRPKKDIKNLYTFTPAVLHDYCRHRVQNAEFPGMIAEKGQSVLGTYVTGLADEDVAKLDNFEGSEYRKEVVGVKLLTKVGNAEGEGRVEGEEKKATTYVFKYPQHLERVEWDFEHFRKEKMSIWTRADYVFEGCDDNAEFEDDFKEEAVEVKQSEV